MIPTRTRSAVDPLEYVIEKTRGVAGGSACLVRTRIPVWSLENCRRLGWTERALLKNFPTLRLQDLQAAWSYAARHKSEIDREIRNNEAA
jgi:uncharacterized protein (DUF433 family)